MALSPEEQAELDALRSAKTQILTTGRVTHIQDGEMITKFQHATSSDLAELNKAISDLESKDSGTDRCPIEVCW